MARLEFVDAQGVERRLDLDEHNPVLIGRAGECDVRVPDRKCSRVHARVVHQSGAGFAVVDLESRNGTRVNGARVEERLLADGDVIEVAGFALRFRAGGEAAAGRAGQRALPEVPVERLVAASNALGCDLWRAAASGPGNRVMSPVSISVALSLLLAGARGATLAQLRQVLHLPGADEGFAATWSTLATELARNGTVSMTNRLFAQADGALTTTSHFAPPLVDALRDRLGVRCEPIDFGAEGACEHINQIVAAATRGRITGLLSPGDLAATTSMALVSAIHFAAAWRAPFLPPSTRAAPFAVEGGAWREVPTMHQKEDLVHARAEGVTLVELPHAVGDTAVVLVVPDAIDGLAELERRLDARVLSGWLATLRQRMPAPVDLALPRFTVPRARLDLTPGLAALGLRDALDPEQANLMGFAPTGSQDGPLYLGKVIHGTFCRLDEQGVEAAAATLELLEGSAMAPPPPTPIRVDRPFLFLIVSRARGLVLFLGCVRNPREGQE